MDTWFFLEKTNSIIGGLEAGRNLTAASDGRDRIERRMSGETAVIEGHLEDNMVN